MRFEKYIRDIENFPKPGILFKDITPLLANYEARQQCLEELVKGLEGERIDKVVSIEARGFFFGILLASQLQAGFVPIRKAGKLPFHTIAESYALEYGLDTLEMHQDAIQEGDRVLLHDDVLATGGTALAACRLIERMGGEIVEVNFLLTIEALAGADKLHDYKTRSLMTV